MKSAAAAETAAMLCKHAAEAGTLTLKPAHQDSTGAHKQSIGRNAARAAPIGGSPSRAAVCGRYLESVAGACGHLAMDRFAITGAR
jgi:hypothetical protein